MPNLTILEDPNDIISNFKHFLCTAKDLFMRCGRHKLCKLPSKLHIKDIYSIWNVSKIKLVCIKGLGEH